MQWGMDSMYLKANFKAIDSKEDKIISQFRFRQTLIKLQSWVNEAPISTLKSRNQECISENFRICCKLYVFSKYFLLKITN